MTIRQAKTAISVGSKEIVFDTNAKVTTTDLIAVASDEVQVKTGASIVAKGQVNTGDTQINVQGDGALLRVSADDQVLINRTESDGVRGDLNIEKGATLAASKSMLVDASRNTTLAGNIEMQGGSLNLSANQINIGAVDSFSTGALNFSNKNLQALDVAELVLNSRNTIDFFGSVGIANHSGGLDAIVFDRLVLNAAGLTGHGKSGQNANIQANTLTLQNSFGTIADSTNKGQGQLNITAGNINQGDGEFKVSGFKTANIEVSKGYSASGNGSLLFDSDVKMSAGYLTAEGGKNMTVTAIGHELQLISNGEIPAPEIDSFGGALKFLADRVHFDGKVALPSGTLDLVSTQGDLTIGANAKIDLSGEPVRFGDVLRYTSGGAFNATAEQGKIEVAQGSLIDVSSGGGDALGGKLKISAVKQYADLSGDIKVTNGSVTLDVARFKDNSDPKSNASGFDLIAKKFTDAGVSQSFDVRSREADIVQTDGQTIAAKKISLASDQGNVLLAGRLNADGEKEGGSIGVYAGDKIVLQTGANLTAKASANDGKGGKVILSSTDTDGVGTHGIAIDKDATINVAGGQNGVGGKVLLRALRTDSDQNGIDDGVDISPISGNIEGASEIFAEGVKKYDAQNFTIPGEIYSFDVDFVIKPDTDLYMTSSTMQQVSEHLGAGIRLRPGIEINYKGDLTLKEQWNFVDWKYTESSELPMVAGGLTINATGNFTVEKALTDGFRTDFILSGEVKDILQTDASWSYKLSAGADFTSAKSEISGSKGKNITLATNPDASPDFPDPFFQHDTVVRTGTGDIELSASGDIIFQDRTSVYSAGKAEAGNRYGVFGDTYVGFLFYGDYGNSGGDLSLNAGRDIHGALSQSPFINQWLVRQGNNWIDHEFDKQSTAWAIDFVKFWSEHRLFRRR